MKDQKARTTLNNKLSKNSLRMHCPLIDKAAETGGQGQ